MDQREKPEIDFPGGEAPSTLQVVDEIVGEGTQAVAGSNVSAHYVGVSFSTGEEFDASWNRGQPLSFAVGTGRVIQGWDEGILGMRVGGRRRLVVPPHLGYGDAGAGSAIKPGETLIFVIDLVAVH